MLIVFQSKSAAEIMMFGEHAHAVLLAAGKEFEDGKLPERGVITRAQMDQAIAGIEALMASDMGHDDSDTSDDADDHPISQHVGMRRRAWPLLMMLKQARDSGEDVIWEPATVW